MNQNLNTTTNYMKDVPLVINGENFMGVGVAKEAPAYRIDIKYPYGDINVLTLDTCARQIKLEPAASKYSYLFVPSSIEKENNCELEIGVYDAKGRDGWGLIQFERLDALLTAYIECNGERTIAHGVSLCQSEVGTLQRLTFTDAVIVKADENCAIIQGGNVFEYTVVPGFCYFTFQDKDGRYHEHTIFGYTEFIIRK